MSMHSLRRLLATAFSGSVLVLAVITYLAPAASGAQYGPTVEPLGPTEDVWVYDFNANDSDQVRNTTKYACDSASLAELPAKAFRDDQNRIDMPTSSGEPPRVRAVGSDPPITWQGSRRMLGPDLNHLSPEQWTNYSDSRLCTAPKSNLTHTNPYAPNFPCFKLDPQHDTTCTDTQRTPSNRAAIWPPPPGYEPWKPENFHDYEWVDSPWAIGDGTKVVTLFHNNYRGFEDLNGDGITRDDCPANVIDVTTYCWYAAVTTAVSTDGGDTFGDPNDWTHVDPPFYAGPPDHLAINSPYMYEPGGCCRQGVPEPTNIIKSGGYEYIVFKMNLPSDSPLVQQGQPQGRVCVARSANVEDPKSWRGWDGNASDDQQNGYTITFKNPYTWPFSASDPREAHVCAPVNPTFPVDQPRTLVYSRFFNQYMLIGESTVDGVMSVYYTLSSDLINWGPKQMLLENTCCYSSILDDDDPAASSSSSERNFYQPDQKAYLYIGGKYRVRTPIKFHFSTSCTKHIGGGTQIPGVGTIDSIGLEQYLNNTTLVPDDSVVCLAANSYAGDQTDHVLNLSRSNITVRNEPGQGAVIAGAIQLEPGANYDRIYGLTINGSYKPDRATVTVYGQDDLLDRDTITNVHGAHSCVKAAYDTVHAVAPQRLTVKNDRIYDCGTNQVSDQGVEINSGSGHVISDNWIYENSGTGVRLFWNWEDGGPGIDSVKVEHNVIADNCATSASFTGCYGQTSFETQTNNSAYRFNTIAFPYAPAGNSTPPYNFYVNILQGGNDVLEDNCFWKPQGTDHTWVKLTDGGGNTILNTRPTTADPQFADRTAVTHAWRNYSVPSGNPCYGKQPSGTVGGGFPYAN
jgi:hypothetical protein